MKKSITSLLLVACLLPCFISFAAANEGYALHTRNFIPEVIYAKLKLMPSADIVLLDKNPSVGSVDYVSWVSYDYLSELSLKWDTSGVIVYNSYMDAYFIRVSYVPTVSNNGEYEYCSLGTSNGFVLGSRNPNSSTTIDNSTTIGTVNLITNKYISTVVNSASKTASSVTNGLTNILSWLEVLSDGIELMIRHQDFTNDILYWIADEFYDMMHLIGEINLTIAEADIEQLKSLNRIDSVIRGISSNQVSLISALNTHLSSVSSQLTGIDTKLSSVIRNGQIQVSTSPIAARLDKLISMYSKVNSVVLDTASVNGGQITGAVGGELKDVVFWGDTGMSSNEFLTPGSLWYRLGPNVSNTTPTTLDDSIVLRSVNLGSTIPSYIANDPVLYAGVWRKGTNYIISDTYNASTGEYVQRVDCVDLGSLSWSYISQGDNSRWFCSSLPAGFLEHDDIYTPGPLNSPRLTNASYSSLFHHTSDVCYSHAYGGEALCFYSSYLDDASIDVSSRLSGFLLMYPRTPVFASYTPVTIAIPEGNSYISSYNVRITGKYETYDSYTQTADIITAINNLQLSSGVGADLTAITTRLDTLINKTSDTVVNVVNNNTYITNVFQLDDDTSVVDTTKDGVGKVSGLFKWLWNNSFKGAFSHADITKLDGLL